MQGLKKGYHSPSKSFILLDQTIQILVQSFPNVTDKMQKKS